MHRGRRTDCCHGLTQNTVSECDENFFATNNREGTFRGYDCPHDSQRAVVSGVVRVGELQV